MSSSALFMATTAECPDFDSTGLPPNVCPSPPDFEAGAGAGWFFFFFAGALAVIVALPFAITRLVKWRDNVPILVICSGFLCSMVEPMLDFLGHLRWADDLPMAFENFGLEVPWLIPFCYTAFFGLEVYFIYTLFKFGVTVKQIFMIFPIAVMTDAVMETVGLNLDVYEYYGVQPYTLFEFPYWWGFINAASFMTCAALVWWLEPILKGPRRLGLLLVAPCGMMMCYFTVGWPHVLAHNSEFSEGVRWAAATVMMIGMLLWVRLIAYFVAVDEPAVDWTFRKLLWMRLLMFMPNARQDMVEQLAAEGRAKRAARADAGAPAEDPDPVRAQVRSTSSGQ